MENLNLVCVHCNQLVLGEEEITVVNGNSVCGECLEKLYIECDVCSEYELAERVQYVDEREFVCETCLEDNEDYVLCRECEEWHNVEYTFYDSVNNNYVCEDCMHDMIICGDCGEITSDYVSVNNDNYVCADCADRNYYRCEVCGEYHISENVYNSTNMTICQSCYEDSYFTCEGCGEIVHIDDCYYNEEEYASYCPDCYEINGGGIIQGYHSGHKNGIEFFESEEDNADDSILYLGYELEVDNGYNKTECASDILRVHEEDIIHFESDGSLNNGFEIISQPCTLKYHEEIKEYHMSMMSTLKEYSFKSHDTSTCGLHVHVNRDFFNNTDDVAKLLYLVSNHWNELVKFSRRKEAELNRWATKCCENNPSIDYLLEIEKAQRGRYYAINLSNKKTIEFRLFKGTMNTSTFYATLQLVSTLCHVVKNNDLMQLQALSFKNIIEASGHYELIS